MSHYSEDEDSVRVDFFREGGKWYTTEAVKWTGPYTGTVGSVIVLIHDAFAISLGNYFSREEHSSERWRLEDMVAVCLEPHHEQRAPAHDARGRRQARLREAPGRRESPMIDRWARLCEPEHVDWTWSILRHGYEGLGRHYHTLSHLGACLQLLDQVTDPRVEKTIAELAIFWHDVVYVPGSPDSEKLSADLLLGVSGALAVDARTVNFAVRSILATKHADSWKFAGNPTVDAVLDIDLSILGSAPGVYESYVAEVRREFHFASEEAWRIGRSKFLVEMLSREKIFLSHWGREWFEHAARENMGRELASLGGD